MTDPVDFSSLLNAINVVPAINAIIAIGSSIMYCMVILSSLKLIRIAIDPNYHESRKMQFEKQKMDYLDREDARRERNRNRRMRRTW